jgi:hypothetical protein
MSPFPPPPYCFRHAFFIPLSLHHFPLFLILFSHTRRHHIVVIDMLPTPFSTATLSPRRHRRHFATSPPHIDGATRYCHFDSVLPSSYR